MDLGSQRLRVCILLMFSANFEETLMRLGENLWVP